MYGITEEETKIFDMNMKDCCYKQAWIHASIGLSNYIYCKFADIWKYSVFSKIYVAPATDTDTDSYDSDIKTKMVEHLKKQS